MSCEWTHRERNFIIKVHSNANEMIQLQSKLPVMKIQKLQHFSAKLDLLVKSH